MKNLFRKILPTLVMLIISAALVGSSTFAWFSMNNKVTVTGMVVKTKVSSNLLIAEDELASTSRKDDSEFTNSLTQVVKGILEPASTADALNFYYTIDAKADGAYSKIGSEAFYTYNPADPAVDSAAYADKFSEVYGVTASDATAEFNNKAVPFVDYVFQLKASNTTSENQYVVVEALNLQYKGELPDSRAHRVAFFVADISGNDPVVASNATGSSSTYTIQSSANFDETGSSANPGKVVDGEASYADADYVAAKQALATVPGNTTKYYKVVVRLWLEGQDTTCNNETFMKLTANWELGIKLALVDNLDSAIVYINQIDSSAALVA